MISLRNRALASGMLWAVLIILGGTYTLANYLDQLTLNRFDDFLRARHAQVVVALANSGGDPDAMARQLSDPVYQRPFSGNYWQVESTDGQIIVSRSLADSLLEAPVQSVPGLFIQSFAGPAEQALRSTVERLTLEDGSAWEVSVAASTTPLSQDRADLRNRINLAFATVGIMAIGGALFVVLFTLRPITRLRHDVAARWDHEGALPEDDYPMEVRPLVEDINALLTRNRDIISRSRRQTADLAHALKTPSAILRNELETLRAQNAPVQASLDALDRLDSQLNRSFARMKAEQDSALEQGSTDLDVSLGRMARAFAALARNNARDMQTEIAAGLTARINQNDLEEIVGNLLDNALKWSKTTIRLAAGLAGDEIVISVEDDGPGIPEDDRDRVLSGGQRLDSSKPGTGLGLAIAHDLAVAYQGTLRIAAPVAVSGARIEVRLMAVQASQRPTTDQFMRLTSQPAFSRSAIKPASPGR